MEERRISGNLQETFLKKVTELSEAIPQFKLRLEMQGEKIDSIKDEQREVKTALIRIAEQSVVIKKHEDDIDDIKKKINGFDYKSQIEVIKSKQSLIYKVMAVLGTCVTGSLLKIFIFPDGG